MKSVDLNHLSVLECLLRDCSVTQAAKNLGIGPPAVSRILSQLRKMKGDPLLVRAGKNLIPTPRALELKDQITPVLQEAKRLLSKDKSAPSLQDQRIFRIRANEAFAGPYASRISKLVKNNLPNCNLVFLSENNEDPEDFRSSKIDLDIGVLGETGPEIIQQTLFVDEFVSVKWNPDRLDFEPLNQQTFFDHEHITISRHGATEGPLDDELRKRFQRKRKISVTVSNFLTAICAVHQSDLMTIVPRRLAIALADPFQLRILPLPFPTPPIKVTQAWHPKNSQDASHRIIRELIFTHTNQIQK
jgi:DNA-binding transcriptional LysR family regulator